MHMLALAMAVVMAAFVASSPARAGGAISVVAAENFYGEVAREIGGPAVEVTSVLSRPDGDPHLFETAPSTARAVAGASIVLMNGAGYDGWMEKLVSAAGGGRTSIVAAELTGALEGANPHLWYRPETLPAVARRLAAVLAETDPGDAASFRTRLARFNARFSSVTKRIAEMRGRFAGTVVTATEPVFGYTCEALGLKVVNGAFQTAVMNEAEPSPRQVAAFENSLSDGSVKLLFYNRQVASPMAERMRALAEANGIPVVGVTELMPPGKTIADWLNGELDAVEAALERAKP
jgi:zinc/manganese transport system substrate-binding protein